MTSVHKISRYLKRLELSLKDIPLASYEKQVNTRQSEMYVCDCDGDERHAWRSEALTM